MSDVRRRMCHPIEVTGIPGYLRLAVSTISTRVSSTTSAAELMMCSTFGVL